MVSLRNGLDREEGRQLGKATCNLLAKNGRGISPGKDHGAVFSQRLSEKRIKLAQRTKCSSTGHYRDEVQNGHLNPPDIIPPEDQWLLRRNIMKWPSGCAVGKWKEGRRGIQQRVKLIESNCIRSVVHRNRYLQI